MRSLTNFRTASLTLSFLSLGLAAQAQRTQPLVAIHDSELTRALETRPAVAPTPTGPGTTGFEWWPTDWHYFVMPESVKEALTSDGTAFTVVGDANITAGALLTNGAPKYPIVISLAAEALRDNEIAPLTNYVAAGGFLLVGSSAFTRNTNGTSRGDFAFANELGLHRVTSGLANWAQNNTFTKQTDHRIISHIPSGQLTWRMPSSSEEIPWGISPVHPFLAPHDVWQVQASDATVLAQGDAYPFLTIKPYGKGYFIYCAAFQPLIGHSGFAPGMYSYVILRRTIEWAFESAGLPVPKLSPWPFQYDAAFMVRHDLENFTNEIAHVEASAQVEAANGAKGDYYFCTGTLRDDAYSAYDTNAIIAGLRRAATNYGATIGSHNGGLKNPNNPALVQGQYDFWHWGPDEALDVTPAGYASGKAYALASLSKSFSDIDKWMTGIPNGPRGWVGCYFNSTREDSYDLQAQAGVKIAGEQKLSPFPHWTVSTKTSGKRYGFLTLPVSDWFVGGLMAQSLEPWHPPGVHTSQTVHDEVDFYYNLGALINQYSHTLSTGEGDAGPLVADYITYGLNTNLHPRVWSANASLVYQWWLARSNAQLTVSYTTNGAQSVTTLSVKGARDTNTAVEVIVPSASYAGLQVLTNGVLAPASVYRATGKIVKVRVGTTVTNAVIRYTPAPTANEDFYVGPSGSTLTVSVPGVLANDKPAKAGDSLTASTVTSPGHGFLLLGSGGGFTYIPTSSFVGVDGFTYRANEGSVSSPAAIVNLMLTPAGYLFFDDFGRVATSTTLAPWVNQTGTWSLTNGVLRGAAAANAYANAYYSNTNWTDYTVQGKVQFSSANGFGGGIGGHLNPTTGAHYGAWVYPDASAGGSLVLKLIKFEGWTTWSFNPMAVASLPAVGTNAHTVTMTFLGANISVFFDGVQLINATDNNFDGVPPLTAGGITADTYADTTPYTLTFDDVTVQGATTAAPVITTQPVSRTNAAGTTASFTVAATGTSLAYQWLKNGTNLAGASTTVLTLPAVTAVDAGGYSVRVSNPVGAVTSATATLTVIDPPVILTQPTSVTNFTGTTATFSVVAGGTNPSYRWVKNDTNTLAGATTATLTLPNLALTDAGSYSVVVTNLAGSVTSAPAILTVIFTNIPPTLLFADDFTRPTDPGTLAPWSLIYGNFTVSGGVLAGQRADQYTYSNVKIITNWADYVLQGQIRFPAGGYGGGLGGHVNPATGAHYAAWVYPEGSAGGSSVLKLVKFQSWNTWAYTNVSYNPMSQVSLPGVGTNWHTLKLAFAGKQITVSYDGVQVINMADGEATSYASGGITVDMWSDTALYSMLVDNVSVTTGGSAPATLIVGGPGQGKPANPAVATAEPVFQSISVADGLAVLTWTAVPGNTYRLQFKESLADEQWQDASENIAATSEIATWTDAVGKTPQRFYRVLSVP